MKTTKRFISVVCVLLVCMTLFTIAASAGSSSNSNWPILSVDSPKNSTTKLYTLAIQEMLFRARIADMDRDGKYDQDTADCVKDFQKKNSVRPYDGIVGPKTWIAFFKKAVLKETMSGDDVRLLQTLLRKLVNKNLKVTGYFGTDTKAAVEKFQKANGLKVDGKVGEKTWSKLFDLCNLYN